MKKHVSHVLIILFIALVALIGRAWSAEVFPGLSEDEKIVTLTILGEARGEGQKGMEAVAAVIQQRMIDTKRSATSVCLQARHFSCWDTADKRQKTVKAFEDQMAVEPKKILDQAAAFGKKVIGGEQLDRQVVKNANHYCTLRTNPYWAKGKTPLAVVGNHKFYRL